MALRKPPPVSIRRVERKVDELAKVQDELVRRVDAFNPNGTYAALKKLADHSDPLLDLAAAAPQLLAAVERDADWATWWKMTRRILNPLRPLGAAVWLVAIGALASALGNHLGEIAHSLGQLVH